MTTVGDNNQLRQALQDSGSDWIFRYWGNDAEKNLQKIGSDIDRFVREYRKRFGERPDPYHLLEINPNKGAAFFQIDTLLLSVEMKVMVWRVLLGCEINRVEFNYKAGSAAKLTVGLRSPYGEEEVYTGQEPSDFRVFRHFGIAGGGGRLFLQGFYAARGV